MIKILLVETDEKYAQRFQRLAHEDGFQCDWCTDALSAVEALVLNDYALLLSANTVGCFPGSRIIETCQRISERTATILLLSGIDPDIELEALKHNTLALDKRKRPEVIMQYIRNVLDHDTLQKQNDQFLYSETEDITMDLKNRTVTKDHTPYTLTRIEFSLLHTFLSHKNQILTREDLIRYVWGDETPEENIRKVDVHIKNLRTKMSLYSIVSVRSLGYKWNEIS